MKFSVIIPAYCAEKTIRRCLDGFVCQLRDDVEIIIVDDGSSDKTGEICNSYVERFHQFRYMYKENGGVSSARNMGLRSAIGEYIVFVDSDDYVSSDFFDTASQYLSIEPDFLLFSFCRESGQNKTICNVPNLSTFSNDCYYDCVALCLEMQKLSSPIAKLFKRSIIEEESICFDQNLKIAEDAVFVFKFLMHSKSFIAIPYVSYHANEVNNESLSRRKREYLEDALFYAWGCMFSELDAVNVPTKYKKILHGIMTFQFYRCAYVLSKEIAKFDYTRKERRKRIRNICKRFNECNVICRNIRSLLIVMPIRLYFLDLIDFVGQYTVKKRNTT